MSQAVLQASTVESVRAGARVPRQSYLLPALLFLVALAFALRYYGLDRESLWLDEGYTLLFSGLPLPRLLTVGGAHEHPPLFYLLVHAGMQIWPSYLVPRVLAALSGALSVPVLYLLGRRIYSTLTGLVAATLLALSPFHLWYSQDARAYELAGLFVLLSYLALFTAAENPRPRIWALYAAATLLALYTEYTTAFVLIPQVVFLLRTQRPVIVSWLVVAAGYLPWLGVLWRDTRAVAGDYWIPPPTVDSLVRTALEFIGFTTPCPSPPCRGETITPAAGHPGAVALLALMATVGIAVWAWRRRPFATAVLVAWLFLPFAIVLALTPVRSLYLDRVFLDATFPLYLLIGLAAARWGSHSSVPRLARGAVLLLLVGALWGLVLEYGEPSNPDWRTLARDLRAAYRPGQSLMFNPGVLRNLTAAYLPPGWHATRQRALWSRSYLDVPGWQQYYPEAVKTDLGSRMHTEATLRDRQLTDVTRGARATWLVTFDYPGLNDSRRWFTIHGYRLLLSELYDGDTRLELWSRLSPSALGERIPPSAPGWSVRGTVDRRGGVFTFEGMASAQTSFPVTPGSAYSVNLEYRGAVPAGPAVTVHLFDGAGRDLGAFPRTQWYELPVPGVWLSQPFGFVAPPRAVRGELRLANRWGQTQYRRVGVYRMDHA